MKHIVLLIFLFSTTCVMGQKFITSGTIEYEVRKNIKKDMSRYETDEDDNGFWAQIKDKIPEFSLNYFTYTFNNTSGMYKFARTEDKQKLPEWFSNSEEDNIWYSNYADSSYTNLKVIDDSYIISGKLQNIQWKLSPVDQRLIAGFNCRKATAILFDSVYLFAYYTDEIAVSGGPMSLHGLPGMILGVTIPRMYASWVATSVKLEVGNIAVPTKGKKKTDEEMKALLTELGKSYGKEYVKYLQPTIWRTFL